jgi:hypothetical protein
MPTDISHFLYHQRIAKEKKILKNKTFVSAFGSPKKLKTKKSSNSTSSIKSKSSSNTLNSPALQSSSTRKSQTSRYLIKIVSSNQAYSNRLVPNVELLLERYPRLKKLPLTLVDLPEALLHDIMIQANLQDEYVLRNWIQVEKLDIHKLCLNPNSITFFIKLYKLPNQIYNQLPHRKKINWTELSSNINAMYLLKKRIEYEKTLTVVELKKELFNIDWPKLSSNINAIDVLTTKIAEEKKLRDIDLEDLGYSRCICWKTLSANPNAVNLLKTNQDKIVWNTFIDNKNLDIDLFEKLLLKIKNQQPLTSLETIDWYKIWTIPNSAVINLLYKIFPEKINYKDLSKNKCSASINLLLNDKNKIDWNNLSLNIHNKAIKLLENDPKRINWLHLALNTNMKAIKLIQDKLAIQFLENLSVGSYLLFHNVKFWENLSKNPKAIKLLETYPDKIHLKSLCQNPNAVKLIRKNIDNIKTDHYYLLSQNPCIFIEK